MQASRIIRTPGETLAMSGLEAKAFTLVGLGGLLGALFCVWVAQAHEAYLVREQGGNTASGNAVAGANFHSIQTSAMGGRAAAASLALLAMVFCFVGAARAFLQAFAKTG